ncbi:MAG: HD domain-containing protein [Solobacterium sp.]|nr:HD domain-containing protein [Solobacterium sp.]
MMTMPTFYMPVALCEDDQENITEELRAGGAAVFKLAEYEKQITFTDDENRIRETARKNITRDIRQALKAGKDVVFVELALSASMRKDILDRINLPAAKTCCILTARQYANCLALNASRNDPRPEKEMKKRYHRIDIPHSHEGWDEIRIVYPDSDQYSLGDPFAFAEKLMDFQQDNPHHLETLGEHLRMTYDNLKGEADLLRLAGLMHDFGKVSTKDFHNGRGEPTEIAHYYNHEHTGAYDSLFFDTAGYDPLHIAFLINYHMLPHDWRRNYSAKGPAKKEKLWGKELLDEVMRLAEADDKAKRNND